MLNDHAGGLGERRNALQRRVRIGNVVVRQGLTLQLDRTGHRANLRPTSGAIEHRPLMGVFPIAKGLPAF